MDRLQKEAEEFKDTTIDTIYFGGGTPSLLPEELIEGLMDHIFRTFKVDKDSEITIEVNPGTVDFDKLKTYRKSGINRLSVGATHEKRSNDFYCNIVHSQNRHDSQSIRFYQTVCLFRVLLKLCCKAYYTTSFFILQDLFVKKLPLHKGAFFVQTFYN